MKPTKQSRELSPDGVLQLLSQNKEPVTFVSPTAALLPGLENWIGALQRVTLTDSFDGMGRAHVVTSGLTTQDFSTTQEVVSYLLQHNEVAPQVAGSGFVFSTTPIGSEHFLTEGELCEVLRENKIPNGLKPISAPADYADFRKQCRVAGLSFSVEVAHADSPDGKPTLLVTSEDDWREHEDRLAGRDLICTKPAPGLEFSIEAVATSSGPALSPLQRMYRDQYWGMRYWTAASCEAGDMPDEARAASQLANKIGLALSALKFRGAYSTEFSLDPANGKLTVSRVVPQLSVHSLLSHAITTFHGGYPLHLLHVLAKSGVDPAIDLKKLQNQYLNHDSWAVLAIRHIGSGSEMITRAPVSGLYRKDVQNDLQCVDQSANWQSALGSDTAYFLRLQGAGNYRAPGSLLGIAYVRQSCLDTDHLPNQLGTTWIDGLSSLFTGLPVSGSSLPTGIITPPMTDIL